MTIYEYTTRSKDGSSNQGTIEASSIQAARSALAEMEVDILGLREVQENIVIPSGETSGSPVLPKEKKEKIVDWNTLPPVAAKSDYLPLADTLRLYCGWLLAWYFLIFAFGSMQALRGIDLHIPLLDELWQSSIVLCFALAAFLFLLLNSLHRLLGRSALIGVLFTLVGLAATVVFQQAI